jgi:hypothetical protein
MFKMSTFILNELSKVTNASMKMQGYHNFSKFISLTFFTDWTSGFDLHVTGTVRPSVSLFPSLIH